MFTGIGEALGDLIINTGNFSDTMLQIMADLAKRLGQMFIMIGTAMAFVPGMQGAAFGLIAGGVALTALGQAGGNLLAQANAGSISSGQSINVNVGGTLRASGRDLVVVYDRGKAFRNGLT